MVCGGNCCFITYNFFILFYLYCKFLYIVDFNLSQIHNHAIIHVNTVSVSLKNLEVKNE